MRLMKNTIIYGLILLFSEKLAICEDDFLLGIINQQIKLDKADILSNRESKKIRASYFGQEETFKEKFTRLDDAYKNLLKDKNATKRQIRLARDKRNNALAEMTGKKWNKWRDSLNKGRGSRGIGSEKDNFELFNKNHYRVAEPLSIKLKEVRINGQWQNLNR